MIQSINAKTELLKLTKPDNLLAAYLTISMPEGITTLMLSLDEDPTEFLNKLDFDYDHRYDGVQNIVGIVWLKDGTWLERTDYNACEWWDLKKRPPIPESLREYRKGEAS